MSVRPFGQPVPDNTTASDTPTTPDSTNVPPADESDYLPARAGVKVEKDDEVEVTAGMSLEDIARAHGVDPMALYEENRTVIEDAAMRLLGRATSFAGRHLAAGITLHIPTKEEPAAESKELEG